MSNDTCSEGDNCSVHNRIDELEVDERTQALTSYVGEYVVITTVAAEWKTAGAISAYMMGYVDYTERYITVVGYLGSDTNSIHDSRTAVPDAEFYRYWVRHNEVDNLLTAHLMVVDGLSQGIIDVSEPKGEEYDKETQEKSDAIYEAVMAAMDAEDA